MKYCPNCGAKLDGTALFCPSCQTSFGEAQNETPIPDSNYDGYYNDILPDDVGLIDEGVNKKLVGKVAIVCLVTLLVIAGCVAALYLIP